MHTVNQYTLWQIKLGIHIMSLNGPSLRPNYFLLGNCSQGSHPTEWKNHVRKLVAQWEPQLGGSVAAPPDQTWGGVSHSNDTTSTEQMQKEFSGTLHYLYLKMSYETALNCFCLSKSKKRSYFQLTSKNIFRWCLLKTDKVSLMMKSWMFPPEIRNKTRKFILTTVSTQHC